MSDDLLQRATAALRETTATPAEGAARERARLLAKAAASQRSAARPPNLWQWAAVLLAGFMVSTAMAHYTGVMPALIEAVSRTLAPQAERPAKKAPKPPKAPQPGPAPQPAMPQPSAGGTAALPEPEPTPAAPEPAPLQPARKPPPPRAARPAEPRGESPELLLFRRAQALQPAHDERALAAWDAYLRVASSGALTPEARYNRALCLLYLKRYAEARSALAPFANGAFQGYRQREAEALLARMPAP